MTDRDGEDQAFVDAISEWPDINDGPTLAGFLLARIAEDEANVRGFRTMPKGAVTCPCGQPGYVGTTSTTRVLAECEAKRRIIDDHDAVHECGGSMDHALGMDSNEWVGYVGCDTLRYLALPYADHPDYRDAWRP